MCIEPNILPFPKRGTIMTKAKLQQELGRLKERLLPYYEDDEEALEKDVQRASHVDIGAVGTMSAIAWCHGQIGLYQTLNADLLEEETKKNSK